MCLGANISFSHDFDDDWDDILRDAREVWDVDKLEDAQNACDDLVDDIEDYIEDNKVDAFERTELKKLTSKAEAMEDFIRTVLLGQSNPISIEDYDMAVSEIGGNSVIISNSYCMQVVKFEFDGYSSLVLYNSQPKTFDFVVKYIELGGPMNGSFESGLFNNHARPLTDNRENRKVYSWKIVSFSCVENTPGY